MSKKKTFRSQYIRKDLNTGSSAPTSPRPEVITSAKYYQSINNLPLSRFIDCLVDQNFYSLIISGHPSDLELDVAWANIRQQYADKMGDTEYKLYLALYKQISILNLNIGLVKDLIGMLEKVYTKQFADKLNGLLNTNYTFDPSNKEEYDSLLKRCFSRSKAFLIQLEIKLVDFRGMQKKYENDGNKPTREYFQSMLITLSDSAGYMIPDSISVFEFCERVMRIYAKIKGQKIKPKR